jgi:hypothetical protein
VFDEMEFTFVWTSANWNFVAWKKTAVPLELAANMPWGGLYSSGFWSDFF